MTQVVVRYPTGTIKIDEDVLFDALTSGPWRDDPRNGIRNGDGTLRERAAVEYD